MCFGCSKEPSHRDGSFEYPQNMFWLRNKKNNFQLRTLNWGRGGGGGCVKHCNINKGALRSFSVQKKAVTFNRNKLELILSLFTQKLCGDGPGLRPNERKLS